MVCNVLEFVLKHIARLMEFVVNSYLVIVDMYIYIEQFLQSITAKRYILCLRILEIKIMNMPIIEKNI